MDDAAMRGSGQHADAVSDKPPLEKVRIGDSPTYIVKEKLGKGGFGVVYVGESTRDSNKVAIKFERIDEERCPKSPIEWKAYTDLKGIVGIPRMHYNGKQGEYYITIMDLLGPSLRDCPDDIASEECVKAIASQAISILEKVHDKGYVHGDIKPRNLLYGPSERKLFLVDFGLATTWKDESGSHVEYDQEPFIFSFSGTVDYASVHTHLGRKRSRRDDLESLAYTLIALLGKLPWQKHEGDDKKFLVCKDKMSKPPKELCPKPLQPLRKFLKYAVQLKFDEVPDYTRCISLFEGKEGLSGSIPKQPIQVRTGKPASQWVSVYDARQPMKQRYHYGVETRNLKCFVDKGMEENLLISSVASCENLWALIINAGTGFSGQIYQCFNSFLDEESVKNWIEEQWAKDFYITAVAGADDGSSLLVMSKGTWYKKQTFHVEPYFPFWWIKEKWADGFYITSMATAGSKWAIVMSRSDSTSKDFTSEQAVELDFVYPFEGIHRRWEKGFLITVAAATQDQVAFVFNKLREPTDEHGQQGILGAPSRRQDTYRTSNFPSKHVQAKWDRNMYVSSLCYGRTIS